MQPIAMNNHKITISNKIIRMERKKRRRKRTKKRKRTTTRTKNSCKLSSAKYKKYHKRNSRPQPKLTRDLDASEGGRLL